jgi:hypothetical protein
MRTHATIKLLSLSLLLLLLLNAGLSVNMIIISTLEASYFVGKVNDFTLSVRRYKHSQNTGSNNLLEQLEVFWQKKGAERTTAQI